MTLIWGFITDFRGKNIQNGALVTFTLSLSRQHIRRTSHLFYCQIWIFWIYWVGTNTKFTVWHLHVRWDSTCWTSQNITVIASTYTLRRHKCNPPIIALLTSIGQSLQYPFFLFRPKLKNRKLKDFNQGEDTCQKVES